MPLKVDVKCTNRNCGADATVYLETTAAELTSAYFTYQCPMCAETHKKEIALAVNIRSIPHDALIGKVLK